jgi:two-component system sensor histidine kinase AgrC
LAAKLIKASQQSIKVSLEIQDTISKLPVDKLDLSRMVGILMDNAIEAAAQCDHSEIRVALIKKEKLSLIIIENTTKPHTFSLAELKQTGVSTKGSKRGLGLHTLSEIIEKYAHIYQETTLEENCFQQKIIFQDPDFK